MDFIDALINMAITILLTSLIIPYPLHDEETMRYRSFPWVTVGIIVVSICVFTFWQYPNYQRLAQPMTDEEFQRVCWDIMLRDMYFGASRIAVREQSGLGAVATFTHLFMHADFDHLFGNMLFLWVFGRRVEDACGPWRFLVFYLFAGMIATMFYYLLITEEFGYSIGASGAISGVMGAYVILFPGARIRTIWLSMALLRGLRIGLLRFFGSGRGTFRWTLTLPAFALILAFLGMDIPDTFQSAETGYLDGRVNYVAHTGGFLSAIVVLLFVRKDMFRRFVVGRQL